MNMDIKILDSALREHLETKAKPFDIARALSLTSASVEKIEKFKKDYLYHIEVTTNRIDMASIIGIAREAAAILPQFGFPAHVIARSETTRQSLPKIKPSEKQTIEIQSNDKLVNRICAVIMEVTQKESPDYIKDLLEAAGIRCLNNLIDVTNYVILEIGHPTHVFDYDRLLSKKLIIRESKKGEKIITLDNKEQTLLGGDIVADNGKGEIIDLLGIMGTLNSVVTDETKRILFFINNNDPVRIRKTSMSLGIRTDAASLNEKNVDPELAIQALYRGIELYQKTADAKIVSEIINIYPKKWRPKTITVSVEKINQVIGVNISLKVAALMLERLDFKVKLNTNTIAVTIPSYRDSDMNIAEDVIEEIARMYGYHNIKGKLPPLNSITSHRYINKFFWENRAKEALKYWGFTEVYTYSMVSKNIITGPIENALTLKNPFDEEHIYMRNTLINSHLEIVNENKSREKIKIFEMANVYHKKNKDLPDEIQTLAGVVKDKNVNFYTVKGYVEQLTINLGIDNLRFETYKGTGADMYLGKKYLGRISVLTENLIVFELNFAILVENATLKKTYSPLSKFPQVNEDLAIIAPTNISTGAIIDTIKNQNPLIKEVSLLDKYQDTRTYHVIYQSYKKNLTSEEVGDIRQKILKTLKEKFNARLKE